MGFFLGWTKAKKRDDEPLHESTRTNLGAKAKQRVDEFYTEIPEIYRLHYPYRTVFRIDNVTQKCLCFWNLHLSRYLCIHEFTLKISA